MLHHGLLQIVWSELDHEKAREMGNSAPTNKCSSMETQVWHKAVEEAKVEEEIKVK